MRSKQPRASGKVYRCNYADKCGYADCTMAKPHEKCQVCGNGHCATAQRNVHCVPLPPASKVPITPCPRSPWADEGVIALRNKAVQLAKKVKGMFYAGTPVVDMAKEVLRLAGVKVK